MTGTGLIDARVPLEEFDFTTAERWHVLVLDGRTPVARVDLAGPGAVSGTALATAVLTRRADYECGRGRLIEHLRGRIAGVSRQDSQPSVSVVVCTRRRPEQLRVLLESLGRLDPAPLEVVIVDNDPGEEDCRAEVEAAGFRYLREDRRGLDNARNAGLRAARGDVVSFIDDDCVASPGWLAPLARAFAHDGVAAVTGPAFPYLLDTPTREMMERKASLARGMRRVEFDWLTMSPLHAAAMGAGANMSFRRELLPGGADPFPPELDAGTETESGGDSYLLGRVLDAGFRVVYDPEAFVFHQHRDEPGALRKAVVGYGIGLSAALTKLVVEERELSAPRAWAWLFKQYIWTQRRRAVGRADAVETRLAWEYLRGGFLGSGRWLRALRTQRAAAASLNGTAPTAAERRFHPFGPSGGSNGGSDQDESAEVGGGEVLGAPAMTVVIPTFRREEALGRCLRALAGQDVPAGTFEVLVVDDDPDGIAEAPSGEFPFPLRQVRNVGRGAAAARNQGAREAAASLLLFIDDDIVPDPGLVGAHLRRHSGEGDSGVVVGPSRPRPTTGNLAAQMARLWWQDFFDLLTETEGTTFVSALTGNVSVRRATFERTGGLAEEYSQARREDWEWGLRMLRAGVPIGFEPTATARHEFTLGSEQRLNAAGREGVGDTLIAATYPEAVANLPLRFVRRPGATRPLRRAASAAWDRAWVRGAALRFLAVLEWARLRGLWLRLFDILQGLSYEQGALASGWRGQAEAGDEVEIDLLGSGPIAPPALTAPTVRVRLGDRTVASLLPHERLWTAGLAEQIVDEIPGEEVIEAAAEAGWLAPEVPHEHAAATEVIFGPGSEPGDTARRGELEEAGAAVRVAVGAPGRHWEAVIAAARAGDRELIAVPLPGTVPGSAWLQDGLTAFDGERVGLAFGGIAVNDLPEPLYLHDARSTDATLALIGERPAYLVLRRELLGGLEPGEGPLQSLVVALAAALDGGWVVGHRGARDLQRPSYGPRERGRAYGRFEAARIRSLPANERRYAAVRETTRGGFTLAWELLKRRGRLTPEQRGLSTGLLAGAVSAARRG